MAEKRLKPTVDEALFKSSEPAGEAPEAPTPFPVEVTYHVEKSLEAPPQLTGQHGLSDDEIRRVNKTKDLFNEAIAYLKVLRESHHDGEVSRCFSVAITEAEAASMWAVKAITWRG